MTNRISRAQGCLLGQLAGDALGSQVEFRAADEIRRLHPDGLHAMAESPVWGTLPGQPTDDSELALALARSLAGQSAYSAPQAFAAYRAWMDSGPFDIGATTAAGLRGHPNPASQANGALMRVSPLGVFGALRADTVTLAAWAAADAALTHPHPVCQAANVVYALAVAQAVRDGTPAHELYTAMLAWATAFAVPDPVREVLDAAADGPPDDFQTHQGWVLVALRNAVWQMLHARTVEAAITDTVMRGGDTDTNAAICGALVGAIHGRNSIPAAWQKTVLSCRPEAGSPGVRKPRPPCYWPVDALELAVQLLGP